MNAKLARSWFSLLVFTIVVLPGWTSGRLPPAKEPRGPTYAKEAIWESTLGSPALVGDFNGDGRAEILSRDGTSVRFTLDPDHPLAEQCHPGGLLPGTNLADAKLADLYGDGRTRILAALGTLYFVLELNYTASKGAPSFQRPASRSFARRAPTRGAHHRPAHRAGRVPAPRMGSARG